ncbi:MAG: DNA replication/repair protein RecF [Bacillota bacterium]
MKIEKLVLKDFRCYSYLEFSPSDSVTVLYGSNGTGKTSILEAISYLATTRSHRTSKDSELVKWGASGFALSALVIKHGRRSSIDMRYAEGRGREITLDGTYGKKAGEILGKLNAVRFSPEDLDIIKGGPAHRRRFLDMEISQMAEGYYSTLLQYNRALLQRNAVLKMDASTRTRRELLPAWDHQLIQFGLRLISERVSFIRELDGHAADIHRRISTGKERLALQYCCSLGTPPGADVPDVRQYEEALNSSTEEDLIKRSTSVGPHRDDIMILTNGYDIRTYGSQGQQRTAAMAIRIAQVNVVENFTGETPALLLDDVSSEIDASRQEMLMDELTDRCQTIITCTDPSGLHLARGLQKLVYEVGGGTVLLREVSSCSS